MRRLMLLFFCMGMLFASSPVGAEGTVEKQTYAACWEISDVWQVHNWFVVGVNGTITHVQVWYQMNQNGTWGYDVSFVDKYRDAEEWEDHGEDWQLISWEPWFPSYPSAPHDCNDPAFPAPFPDTWFDIFGYEGKLFWRKYVTDK